ncbi:MAG: PH domain-containing protein [Gammaproteobacteria bacterium]
MQVFRSKRDLLLWLILSLSVLIDLGAAVALLSADLPSLSRAISVAVLLATAALVLWIMYGTRYLVDQGMLTIYCGPFRKRLRVSEIESVEPTRSPLSSPALSLDRLRITYAGGKKIMVSPEDPDRFRNAIGQAQR